MTDSPNEEDVEPEGARAIAAVALAAGRSPQQAAHACGRTKRTIARWLAEPGFARLVSDMRSELVAELSGPLPATAVGGLAESLTSENPRVRLRAVHLYFEWSLRLRRAMELEADITEAGPPQGSRTDGAVEGDENQSGEATP